MMIIGVLLIVVLALLGTPLFAILGTASMTLFSSQGTDTQAVIVELYRLAANPFMITIPLFTFAGFLMAEAGTAKRIARLARAGLGWLPGGLVLGVILACSFFTTFSGASGVTIIALGALMLPVLKSEKYPDKFAYGLCTAAGSMGLLFPPSLPLLVYGMVAGVEVDKLFLAGMIPGGITVLALAVYGGIVAFRSAAKPEKMDAREFFSALNEVKWELFVPVIIVVGIFGGIVTVAEVSAITVLYLFIVEVFIYKDLKIGRDMPRVIRKSMMLVGAILIILGCALGLTNYLVDAEVPMKIFAVAQQYFTSKWTFLLALNVFLLIVGGFLDIFSATFVVVPLILPVACEVGIDPIHLGIIFIANLQIGYLLPPAGIDLCVASLAFNRPMVSMYRIAVPFVIVLFVALMLVTYVPWLSLGLVERSITPGGAREPLTAECQGQVGDRCDGVEAFSTCVAKKCSDVVARCLGDGATSGTFGGACGAYRQCVAACPCDGDPAACEAACAEKPGRDAACTACEAEVAACVRTSDCKRPACQPVKCGGPCIALNNKCDDLDEKAQPNCRSLVKAADGDACSAFLHGLRDAP